MILADLFRQMYRIQTDVSHSKDVSYLKDVSHSKDRDLFAVKCSLCRLVGCLRSGGRISHDFAA